MRHLAPLLAGPYVVFLGWYGARLLGEDWRRDLLVALLGAYAAVTVLAYLFERRVRRQFDAAHPEDLAALRDADPEIDAFIADRPRVNERIDWGWRATDFAAGAALTFYPPLAYTFWRYRALEADTPFDGVALALMVAGVVAYTLWRRRRLRTYRCPACGAAPARLAGERIRFSCRRCGVTWRLGNPVPGDGKAAAPRA